MSSDVNGPILRFRFAEGEVAANPREWLDYWAARYPRGKYPSIENLIHRGGSGLLSSQDFEWIGKWKDGALSGDKWKPNVAMVAYEIWMLASSMLPGVQINDEAQASRFLTDWGWRMYKDTYRNGSVRIKKFGLSRASTLLHVMSGGIFPILDSTVRTASKRLTGSPARKDDVNWYFRCYRSLFQQVMDSCQETDARKVDEAMFSYGQKGLVLLDKALAYDQTRELGRVGRGRNLVL